jgi:Aldehyde dehydrogenase family
MSAAAFQIIDEVPTYNLFIGGEWVPSSRNEATASYNPATGEIYARVHQAGARETEAAIDAAHGAYKDWADKVVSEREGVFLRAADVLATKSKEIVEVLIEESGSVAGKAGFEVLLLPCVSHSLREKLRCSRRPVLARRHSLKGLRLEHLDTFDRQTILENTIF